MCNLRYVSYQCSVMPSFCQTFVCHCSVSCGRQCTFASVSLHRGHLCTFVSFCFVSFMWPSVYICVSIFAAYHVATSVHLCQYLCSVSCGHQCTFVNLCVVSCDLKCTFWVVFASVCCSTVLQLTGMMHIHRTLLCRF